jgi:hypothetical protein
MPREAGTFVVDLAAGLARRRNRSSRRRRDHVHLGQRGRATLIHLLGLRRRDPRAHHYRRRRLALCVAGLHAGEASIAMFAVHVQEAIDTAPESASTLTLVEGGVVAE